MKYEKPSINVTPLNSDILEVSDGGYIALPDETFPEE